MRRAGTLVLVLAAALVVAGPAVAPHEGGEQFRAFLFAPPMPIRIVDEQGGWHAPFVYPLRLVDRVERRYAEERARRVPLAWFSQGKLVRAVDEREGPLLLLGADALGRDIFARLVIGARASLGVALVAGLGTLLLGLVAGGIAGYAGGWIDEALMRLAEFVLVLPAIYVILALRAVMPLVLPPDAVFALMAGLLALVAWPYVARGVRAIVATERQREYAAAAQSLGASHSRILVRHLLPAARGFLAVQVALLLPAFILAEATLSFVGLGFPEPTPTWGTMLQDARNIAALVDFPWLLSPAVCIVTVVLAVNLLAARAGASEPVGLVASLERRLTRRAS